MKAADDPGDEYPLTIAATGAANLASVGAMCERAGVRSNVSSDPDQIFEAGRVLLPGVGAFGAAMGRLTEKKLDEALKQRILAKKPTMGICLGMQMFCVGSEESPDIPGIGVIPARVGKFRTHLPLPQLGWNRIHPAEGKTIMRAGWAYYANSYRLVSAPENDISARSVYGESFVAALEEYATPDSEYPFLLLCQFHPELSGPWGLDLFCRWMKAEFREDAHG